jgi:hypothetical protein
MQNTLNRQNLMMRPPLKKLFGHYKPLLTALFEYYLYESYPFERSKSQVESLLPLSAITAFYSDFAAGESARLNRTTLYETINSVIGVDPIKLLKADSKPLVKESSNLRKVNISKHEPLKGMVDNQKQVKTLKGVVFSFYDFVELVFEISQEINVNRNETTAQKFRDYMEKVILLNIRYKLPLKAKEKNES